MPRADDLSGYDEAVPHPGPDPVLAGRFRTLRPAGGDGLARLSRVSEVVLLVSSSRGGSSLVSEVLRRCSGLLSLPGELNPYVVVAQLEERGRRAVLAEEIARDLGSYAVEPPDDLVRDCAWRLTAAWPHVEIAPDEVERAVAAAVWDLGGGFGSAPEDALTAGVVRHLRRRHPELELQRYDVSAATRREEQAGGAAAPAGPHSPVVVEMAPFRLLRPWRHASDEELATRPVVLGTPRNAYRLEFLRALFPAARVRVLHLVRNPAAAVNGLMDGWRHGGFFTVRVPEPLDLAGYTDRFPEWGGSWWKYDLPPTWHELRTAPLARVAAEQWRSAHETVLAHGPRPGDLRLRYEDLTGDPRTRRSAARELADWLAVPSAELEALATGGLPPQMATVAPEPGRWRRRSAEVELALRTPGVLDLAEELGYGRSTRTWT